MKLGIKGNLKKSKEIINLLKNLGGWNYYNWDVVMDNKFYSINAVGYIECNYIGSDEIKGYVIYSIEDFLKKFPYKVGDIVVYPNEGSEMIITSLRWDDVLSSVVYELGYFKSNTIMDGKIYVSADKLNQTNNVLKYYDNLLHTTNENEEIIEKSLQDGCVEYGSDSDIWKLDIRKVNTDIEYPLPDGFQFFNDKGEVIDTTKVILKRIKDEYPKTYEECCKILGIDTQFCMKYLPHGPFTYKEKLIYNLQELLICRDAYWKIAGEKLGLGKPWEPDYSDDGYTKYNIFGYENDIMLNDNNWSNRILAFPTPEIRNIFYDNFKDLIKQCKELL